MRGLTHPIRLSLAALPLITGSLLRVSFRNLTTGFALIVISGMSLSGQELDQRVVPHSKTNPNGLLLYVKNKVESAEIKRVFTYR
jgi:hypothetical protein